MKPGEGDDTISPDHEDTLRRMIESLRFAPWEDREVRDGLTALVDEVGPVEAIGTFMSWHELDGGDWAFLVGGEGDAASTLYGYVTPPCTDATFTVDVGETAQIAQVTCGGAFHAGWTSDGAPVDANPPELAVSLEPFPAVASWEGYLLVRF